MSSVSTTSSRRVRAHGTDRRHRSSAGKKSSSPQEDISLRKSFADSMLFDNEDLDTLEDLKSVRAPSSLETAMMSSVSTLPSSGAGDIIGDDPAMSQRRLSSSVSTRRFNEWDSTLSNRNFEDLSALDRANREVAGRTLASFTVTDPRYQRSEEYFPDKINDWVESFPDYDVYSEMAVFNEAHLKEVRDMTDGLEALRRRGPLEQWEIRSLKIWYRAHYLWTSRRFQVTRSYSMPRWEERIVFPVIIKEAQDEFQKDLHRLAYIIDRLEEGDTIEDQLLDAWDDYADHLELSMKLFTEVGMMLVYSYFSYEEHTAILAESELIMKIGQHTHAIGSVIGFCGVETFRDTIMQREASHVGVSWDGFYKERWEDYLENVAGHLDAIVTGDPEFCNPDSSGSLRTSLVKKRRVKVIALPDDCVPFNPLDVKYQKNEHYPPNKLDEWLEQSRLHVEDSAWVLANNAHRIECWIMKETLQFVASRGDTSEWIVNAIKKWWSIHKEWTTSRIKALREHTLPALEMRFHYPPRLLEAQNNIERHILGDLDDMIDDLEPNADPLKLYDLLDEWSDYEMVATKGLDLMEPMSIMLFHAFFSVREGEAIVKAEHHRVSPYCIGAMAYHAEKDGLAPLQINHIELDYRRKDYEEEAMHLLHALRGGEPPKKGQKGTVVKFLSMLHSGLESEQI